MSPVGPKLLTHLLNEHGAALVLYARQWCHVPEDVVQDAFLQLMRQVELPKNIAAWLYRVVRNGAISQYRSATRRDRHESAVAHQGEPWFHSAIDERLDASAATEALAQLPPEPREILVARLWGGLSYDEIAELTETSRTTVFRRYQAALTSLRERLRVPCPGESDHPKT